jgi:transcriptional regulator GlxA family with amidase domain
MRFRKATGRSILNEIHAVRLEFAKQLLSEGGLPLKTISDFCGFDHANSLRKFFKKQTGKTMSEWKDTRPSNTFR